MDLSKAQHLTLPADAIREVTGFGMASRADGYVFTPLTVAEIQGCLEVARKSGRQVVLRGAGRSYGDASILREGIVLDLTQMKRFQSWDSETGIADCEPGVTIEDLWRVGLQTGWWPPVVSGTMFVTLGGALAMNIHGKNNFKVGPIGDHVLEIDFMTADGKVRTLTPTDDLFREVVSSAGLLGIVTRVKIQMKKVASGNLRVYAEAMSNWDAQFEAFEKRVELADYMVSWVDCFARDKQAGRGLFHAAWHDSDPDMASLLEMEQDLPDKILGVVPKSQVWRILRLVNNRFGMRTLNALKYLSATLIGNTQMHSEKLVQFSFLLDYVPDWKKAYGPGGFIQYQSFVNRERARSVFARQVEISQAAKLEPFLGVLKKHRADDFALSHAVDGFSLALDYKVTEENWASLEQLCHRMNDVVVEAGGRFYLAKDSTLRPSDIEATLGPQLRAFKARKAELDPTNLFSSELAIRLDLCKGGIAK